MKKLILIGLPGSGKTTVGGLLARQLGLPFRDCDPQVERLAGRTVAQLFSCGEECFRRWETAALQALCAGEDCVLATGGGAVLRPENRALLRRSGVVFWLDRPVADIERTLERANRPLLAGAVRWRRCGGSGRRCTASVPTTPSGRIRRRRRQRSLPPYGGNGYEVSHHQRAESESAGQPGAGYLRHRNL